MEQRNQKIKPVNFVRTLTFKREADDKKEKNSYDISFSSETGVERYDWWEGKAYTEYLGHESDDVDLSRLKDMGVLLFNHNRDKVIGPVLEPKVDTVNHRCTATIKFDDDDESQIIKRKVDNGTLKGVSVAYSVSNWEEVASGQKSKDGRFEGPCSVARKWQPYEVSIVSIPADADVGVGRALEDDNVLEKLRELLGGKRSADESGKESDNKNPEDENPEDENPEDEKSKRSISTMEKLERELELLELEL